MTVAYLDGLFDGATGKQQDERRKQEPDYQAGYKQGWVYWLQVPSIHPLPKGDKVCRKE